MQNEEWRDIPGYEGYYQASNRGNIRSLDREVKHSDGHTRKIKGQPIKPSPTQGYLKVTLRKNGTQKTQSVHRLVASAFLGDITDKIVCHKNDIGFDNHVDNLYIGEHKNQYEDRVQNGNHGNGEKNSQAKLTKKDVLMIRKMANTDMTNKKIAELFDISPSYVSDLKLKKRWAHI